MKSMGRMGILRESLCSAMIEIGRDWEGSDLIRFLTLRSGRRFFSRSTAWSRPRSLRHLMRGTESEKVLWKWWG